MKRWDEMTYDEQRALLGLPDVRGALAWMNLRNEFQRVATGIGEAFAQIGRAWKDAQK